MNFQPQRESPIETEDDISASNPEKKRKISIWDKYEDTVKKVKPSIGTSTSHAIQKVQRYLDEGLIPRKENPLKW